MLGTSAYLAQSLPAVTQAAMKPVGWPVMAITLRVLVPKPEPVKLNTAPREVEMPPSVSVEVPPEPAWPVLTIESPLARLIRRSVSLKLPAVPSLLKLNVPPERFSVVLLAMRLPLLAPLAL